LLQIKINKKGVSIMVAYVLLIIIAISISLVVYAFIKAQVPGEIKECSGDASVVMMDYECGTTTTTQVKWIEITFKNNGLFTINGVLIKGSNSVDSAPITNLQLITAGWAGIPAGQGPFSGAANTGGGLIPGDSFVHRFQYAPDIFIPASKPQELIEVEFQPYKLIDNDIVPCQDSIQRFTVEGCN